VPNNVYGGGLLKNASRKVSADAVSDRYFDDSLTVWFESVKRRVVLNTWEKHDSTNIKYRLSSFSSKIWTAGKWSGEKAMKQHRCRRFLSISPSDIFSFFAGQPAKQALLCFLLLPHFFRRRSCCHRHLLSAAELNWREWGPRKESRARSAVHCETLWEQHRFEEQQQQQQQQINDRNIECKSFYLRRRFKCQIERNSKLLDNYYDNLNDFVTLQQKNKTKTIPVSDRKKILSDYYYQTISKYLYRTKINVCDTHKCEGTSLNAGGRRNSSPILGCVNTIPL